MTITFFWHLPTAGDGRYGDAALKLRGECDADGQSALTGVSDPRGRRFNYYDYLHQITRAAELAGFDGIRIPDNGQGEEPWIVAGYIAPATRKLTLLTEFAASRGSAVYAAKNAASYQRYTNGRFAWQIHVGGDAEQRRRTGDFIADTDINSRIEEFVTVARGVFTQAPWSYKGRFFEVLDGGFKGPLANQTVPPVYLSGHSLDALQLSAKIADVHIFEAAAQARIDYLQQQAALHRRTVAVGFRIDLIARETEEEAYADALRYARQIGRKAPANALWWPGLTTAATGAAATLVGSYQQVISIIASYIEAGVSHFQLSAIPHFEEAYRIGEHVLPALRALADANRQNAA